jgi:hypothetical protein
MDDATQILVIINSAILTIFLLVGIYLMIQALGTVRRVKKLVARAENAAEAVEAASEALRSAAKPFKFGRYFANIADTVAKAKKGGRRG